MSTLDIVLFFVAVVSVIAFGIWKGVTQKSEGGGGHAGHYFLAGRGLTWWLVGFSLIAANISTEQFVGMSGQAADWLGMAIASYEWMAAITLVVVAFLFLPKLLRAGVFTIPEFLEHRYGVFSRTVMAVVTMVILVGVPTAAVIYSGATVISVFFAGHEVLGFDLGNLTVGCWAIGVAAAVYVFVGGLRACAWTDLIWGSALIAGGALVLCLALGELGKKDPAELMATKTATSSVTVEQLQNAGAIERLQLLNAGPAKAGDNLSGGKLHMVRPKSDPAVPWTALLVGLWIPNFFYWGLNQYIMQRTLASKSLAEGQKGIVFAAFLKLLVPFVVVIPGILAFNLYSGDLRAEAAKKNAATLRAFEAGGFDKLLPFTAEFAQFNPGEAAKIAAHNAALAGVAAPAAGLDAAALAEASNAAVTAGGAKGIGSVSKLVGHDYDKAFGTLLRKLLRPGFSWFVLAAMFGAVVSSLASMLNSASTIFTMDIYHKLFPRSSQKALVSTGKVCTVVFVVIACVIAPGLGSPAFGGIFTFIQEFQGFISPGVLAVFLFGFLVPRAPRYLGWLGIASNAVLYGALKWWIAPELAFLNRMAVCLAAVGALLAVLTFLNPLKTPVVLPENKEIALESSRGAKLGGIAVVVLTLALYAVFW